MKVSNPSADLAKLVVLAHGIKKDKDHPHISTAVLASLPEVTEKLLTETYKFARNQSLTNPWLAWATCYALAYAAKRQKVDPYLEARAAWNLGWSANECVEPRLAKHVLTVAKRLFTQVHANDWASASTWQLYALPWTTTNLKAAKVEVESALSSMRESGMESFVPKCQQTLAFIDLVINSPETLHQADQLISSAEREYALQGDPIGVARAQRQRAAWLTRRGKHSEAVALLEKLRSTFTELGAPIEAAKVNYQLSLNLSTMGDFIAEARCSYQQAISIYRPTGLSLLEAECLLGLGILLTRTGSFQEAENNLLRARKIFEQYQIPALIADNLTESGRLANVAGDYSLALRRFQRSLEINQRIGSRLQAAISKTNLGHTYARMGLFQTALVHLEDVCRELDQMGSPSRVADCRLYLADTWARLGRFSEALAMLEAIEDESPKELKALAFETCLKKAYCLIGSQQFDQAHNFLLKSMAYWQGSGAKPDLPLLRLALGFLHHIRNESQAETILEQSLVEFQELRMAEEEAFCLSLLGDIYASSNRWEKAVFAWKEGNNRVKEGSPEIRIRCLTSLAEAHEIKGLTSIALAFHEQAAQVVNGLAPDFWQSSIFSWQIAQLSSGIEKSLRFFLTHNNSDLVIQLMEKIKAHTFKHTLLTEPSVLRANHISNSKLRSAQNTIQENLRIRNADGDWLASLAKSQSDYAKLTPLIEDWERRQGYLQREKGKANISLSSTFDVDNFRTVANNRLGRDWLGVDYYEMSGEIVIAFLTPDQLLFKRAKLTPRLKMAISAAGYQYPEFDIPWNDLRLLAEQLLPREMFSDSKQRRALVISPHKDLWSIPWAGLPIPDTENVLIDLFSPVTVPSLESLSMLWGRTNQWHSKDSKGAFIGLSEFSPPQRNLPFVLEEFNFLTALGVDLDHLLDEHATRKKAMQVLDQSTNSSDNNLSFFHLATHLDYESRSNVLCQLQLRDGPIWSEELLATARLPGLVYVSACNGTSCFTYEGGEQIGFPLTCLSKGASTVIGSWSPIGDKAGFRLTTSFYEMALKHKIPVAEALARAQLQLRDEGFHFFDWAFFTCLGVPDLVL